MSVKRMSMFINIDCPQNPPLDFITTSTNISSCHWDNNPPYALVALCKYPLAWPKYTITLLSFTLWRCPCSCFVSVIIVIDIVIHRSDMGDYDDSCVNLLCQCFCRWSIFPICAVVNRIARDVGKWYTLQWITFMITMYSNLKVVITFIFIQHNCSIVIVSTAIQYCIRLIFWHKPLQQEYNCYIKE